MAQEEESSHWIRDVFRECEEALAKLPPSVVEAARNSGTRQTMEMKWRRERS